jgi:hypothetical protein
MKKILLMKLNRIFFFLNPSLTPQWDSLPKPYAFDKGKNLCYN